VLHEIDFLESNFSIDSLMSPLWRL